MVNYDFSEPCIWSLETRTTRGNSRRRRTHGCGNDGTELRPWDDPDGYLYRTAMNLWRSRSRRLMSAIRPHPVSGHARDAFADIEHREQEPGTQGQPADVLEVDCSDGETSLESSKVQVQSDGVHIRVRSPGGSLFATLQDRDAGQFDTFTKRLHDQVTRFVYPYPPGTIYVRCIANDGSLGSGVDELPQESDRPTRC